MGKYNIARVLVSNVLVILLMSLTLLSNLSIMITANAETSNSTNVGYVKYTLVVRDNILYKGNVVNSSNYNATVWGITYDPKNGYIYVTNLCFRTVYVINSTTNRVVNVISVGSHPEGIYYDPSNGYIYVANCGSGTISIISTPPAQVTKFVSLSPVYFIVAVAVVVLIIALIRKRK